jgi:hypothetical protein
MTVANRQEAEDRGWTPSMGTFGVKSDPNAGDNNNNNNPSPGPANPYGDLGKISAGFAASAGMTQKQLDEQIRQFDQTLEWQKQQWRDKGLPELAISQRAQQLEEDKFKELSGQAHRQQDWVEQIGTRQAALAEKSQADANAIEQGKLGVSQGQLGVSQGNLGLDTLKTAASLSGPADWIKATNFNRGVSNSNLPGFINQLLSGQSTATLGGPQAGAQMSAPLTMGSLAQGLGAMGQMPGQAQGTPAPSPYYQAQAGQQQQAGAPQAPNQFMEAQNAYNQYRQQTGQAPLAGANEQMPQMTPEQMQQKYAGAQQTMQPAQYMEGAMGQTGQYQPGAGGATEQMPGAGGNMQDRWSALRQQVGQQNAQLDAWKQSGYGGAAAPQDPQQALRDVYSRGGQALGPQQLEGLTSTEMSMFQGGGGSVGADVPGFMEQYKRSRIGQSASSGAY